MDPEEWTDRRSWKEFRETGLLWFINQFLHVFGWAIAVEIDKESGEITDSFPMRVRYRGFREDHNSEGYEKVNRYMREKADRLYEEAEYDDTSTG